MSDFMSAMLAEEDVAFVDEERQRIMCRVCKVYVSLARQYPLGLAPTTQPGEERRRWKLDWNLHRQRHFAHHLNLSNSKPHPPRELGYRASPSAIEPSSLKVLSRPSNTAPLHHLGLSTRSSSQSSSSAMRPERNGQGNRHVNGYGHGYGNGGVGMGMHVPNNYATPRNSRAERDLEHLREQELLSDSSLISVEPYRALCARCHQWIQLDAYVRYSVLRWQKHVKECPYRKKVSDTRPAVAPVPPSQPQDRDTVIPPPFGPDSVRRAPYVNTTSPPLLMEQPTASSSRVQLSPNPNAPPNAIANPTSPPSNRSSRMAISSLLSSEPDSVPLFINDDDEDDNNSNNVHSTSPPSFRRRNSHEIVPPQSNLDHSSVVRSQHYHPYRSPPARITSLTQPQHRRREHNTNNASASSSTHPTRFEDDSPATLSSSSSTSSGDSPLLPMTPSLNHRDDGKPFTSNSKEDEHERIFEDDDEGHHHHHHDDNNDMEQDWDPIPPPPPPAEIITIESSPSPPPAPTATAPMTTTTTAMSIASLISSPEPIADQIPIPLNPFHLKPAYFPPSPQPTRPRAILDLPSIWTPTPYSEWTPPSWKELPYYTNQLC